MRPENWTSNGRVLPHNPRFSFPIFSRMAVTLGEVRGEAQGFVLVEGLGDVGVHPGGHRHLLVLLVRVSTHGEDRDASGVLARQGADAARGVKAVKVRHHDVHEDEAIMPVGGTGELPEPFEAIAGPCCLGPGPFEEEAKDLGVQVVVFDHEHFFPAEGIGRGSGRGLLLLVGEEGEIEDDREEGPFPGCAINGEGPAKQSDDFGDDG